MAAFFCSVDCEPDECKNELLPVSARKLLAGVECFDTGTYDYVGTLTATDVQKNLDYITQYVYNSANRTVTTCRAPSRSADTTYDAFGNDKPTGSSGDTEIMSEDYALADFSISGTEKIYIIGLR